MSSNNRLVGFRSSESLEQSREARLVRIARGTFAIGLDPFGMLDPQVVVNLLPELGVGMDLVQYGHLPRGRFLSRAWTIPQEHRRNRQLRRRHRLHTGQMS